MSVKQSTYMATKLTGAGQIKEGNYILIDGVACKVMNLSISKPGKHGASKARIVAIGLIDGKKRELVKPGSENVEVPIIEKKTAQVLSIREESTPIPGGEKIKKIANVMDDQSYETFDLDVPEDLVETVKEGTQI